jgi:N-acetyl-anhydromuramyl-L-alanine amidase AmpD
VGIEMAGYPHKGPGLGATPKYSKMYTQNLLNSTAKLVADILKRNNLPFTGGRNSGSVRGHEDLDPERRSDPGASRGNFDWVDFMNRVKSFK